MKFVKRPYFFSNEMSVVFPIPETIRGDGYKFSAQRFLRSFWWTSVTHDWLMVALNTMDQS